MNWDNLQKVLNLWVILGACAVGGILTVLTVVGIGWTRPPQPLDIGFAPAYLTVIPAPTSTPPASLMPTLDPLLADTPTPEAGVIYVGGYVQISGTEGEGLRLRAAPGLDAEPLFLGYDAEVFEVRAGPQEADGYVWWYLVAPYDETRAGWAAADFLAFIPAP